MMEIRKTEFDGLTAMELQTERWRMVVVTGAGPRIAWFSKPDGGNLLYWDKDFAKRGEWRLFGGHRVWLTRPMADESEDAYLPDNDPCSVTLSKSGLTAFAPPAANRIARGMKIRTLPDGRVRVTNCLRNEGDMLYSGGVWSPTCVVADAPIEIPLGCANPSTAWDVVYMAIPRVFAGNVTKLDDDSAAIVGDTLTLTPKGRCVKRCVRAEQGVVQQRRGGTIFRKTAEFLPDARYPLGGCNIAAFIGAGNWMVEMETFSSERAIKPGETAEHDEIWEILDGE
jgi:hypothetical protein